jgi:hypothetical protein
MKDTFERLSIIALGVILATLATYVAFAFLKGSWDSWAFKTIGDFERNDFLLVITSLLIFATIGVLIGEFSKIQSLLYYVVIWGVAATATPFLLSSDYVQSWYYSYSQNYVDDEYDDTPQDYARLQKPRHRLSTRDDHNKNAPFLTIYATAGFVGGLAYWLIAGRRKK